ncbi:MAG TPA: 2-isopropylmalate synthase [Candidatus Paceibacterota bacterium]|nr:2-isopropylmalate synthase [Candidatus Paceibacterota bacterium]
MNTKAKGKYVPFPPIDLPDRTWPGKRIKCAPIWASVDLRDGNQALPVPMTVEKKLRMFAELVRCGFKEIEIGFPSSNPTEFEFVRRLIGEGLVPDDVTIQVLVQAKENLIKKTVESLVGAKKAVIHLYNSTSPSQRRIVFGLEKPDIVRIATDGAKRVADLSVELLSGTDLTLEYSPESFSATEVEFSVEICEAVMDIWKPTSAKKMIINLPDTVEVAMPNVYADQIELFSRSISRRDSFTLSVHTHNDRGTGVAATELALLAGAERVEGTLFGNGERTGNLDIVTVALNMHMQGIDSGLDFSDLDRIRAEYEACTGMEVPPRQPYAGELVFTAFSGSHQDAIRKGFMARKKALQSIQNPVWDVPYLTIDPEDVGRTYAEVIRVNGQSGKGGVAYILETECGICLPKEMQREFGPIANDLIDRLGKEARAFDLEAMFRREYIDRQAPYALLGFHAGNDADVFWFRGTLSRNGSPFDVSGSGNGPVAAFMDALRTAGVEAQVLDYHEHALGQGSEASAIAYVSLRFPDGGVRWGAGIDPSIETASLRAVISALNRR